MKSTALFFLLGISSIYFLPTLPPLLPLVAMALCLALACLRKRKFQNFFKFAFVMTLGVLWVSYYSQQVLSWTLPNNKISVPVAIEGTIASIPMSEAMVMNFLFHMTSFDGEKTDTTIKLAFYKTAKNQFPDFKVGEHWCLVAKLKPPHHLNNPASFDTEQFDFASGIRATGYIVDETTPSGYACHPSVEGNFKQGTDRLREKLLHNMKAQLEGKPYAAFIYALTIGEKMEITANQWQVFQNTGTNHLMAIAGLHIGFLAGLIFFIFNFMWKRVGSLALIIPSHKVGAIAGLISAILYAALAGFAIPTQRALVMLSVFVLSLLCRRNLSAFHGIALALMVVLIWNPLSVLMMSFWLSFGAITLLAFGLSARFKMNTLWWKHGRMQWVVSLGLIPFTILFFSNASLISPLANSLAIPWVGFVTVPLSLLGAFLSLGNADLAHYVLLLAEWTLHPIMWILEKLSSVSFFSWQHVTQHPIFIFPALIGIFLALAPRGLPNRYLALFFIAPLMWPHPMHPKANAVWFHLLEVGQGLSAIVQTEHHVLIFDTGPRFNENYDMGRMVLIPFLAYQGISKVDRLVISHPHDDHIGGAPALLKAFPTTEVLTSAPNYFEGEGGSLCLKGQAWNWDGVDFEFLHPSLKDDLDNYNNSSCVLKISVGRDQLLLTGDIEKPAEEELLAEEGANPSSQSLKSSLIVVPHHGSKTSSTEAFLKEVDPKIAFIPRGYLNRFHFPDQVVVERYRARGVKLYDTASDGYIFVKWDRGSQAPEIEVSSNKGKHVWNQKFI